jgi:hypothetical protein
MRMHIAYEVVDFRTPKRLTGVGIITTQPGGLVVTPWDGRGEFFALEEDDQLEDLEDAVVIHGNGGRVVLTPLTLALYRDSVEPFVEPGRDFVDDNDVSTYYYQLCVQAMS